MAQILRFWCVLRFFNGAKIEPYGPQFLRFKLGLDFT